MGKNCKLVVEKSDEDTNGKTFCVHELEDSVLLKCDLYIQRNFYQNPNGIFHKANNTLIKSVQKHKRPLLAKTILSKKKKSGGTTPSDFKIYCKLVIKTVQWQHKMLYIYKPMEI